jgi:hypothetical protein
MRKRVHVIRAFAGQISCDLVPVCVQDAHKAKIAVSIGHVLTDPRNADNYALEFVHLVNALHLRRLPLLSYRSYSIARRGMKSDPSLVEIIQAVAAVLVETQCITHCVPGCAILLKAFHQRGFSSALPLTVSVKIFNVR